MNPEDLLAISLEEISLERRDLSGRKREREREKISRSTNVMSRVQPSDNSDSSAKSVLPKIA